ncbi:MAG: integrase, partial [Burkholderiaceae bacterium]
MAPMRLLEAGSFRGVIMAKLKLTKSAVDAAQPQARAVELRDTVVP